MTQVDAALDGNVTGGEADAAETIIGYNRCIAANGETGQLVLSEGGRGYSCQRKRRHAKNDITHR